MGEKWMCWTLGEAGTKTATKLLHKVVGMASATVGHTVLAVMITGFVQMLVGGIVSVTRANRHEIIEDWRAVGVACLFGVFATIATLLAFMAFLYGGDVGVNTFIITLSIVPGALIDRVFFCHRSNPREMTGIALAIFAGYLVLGWPSIGEIIALPLWVWCSAGTMVAVAVNQGITQAVRRIDPFVQNFWGGLTTVLMCGILMEFVAPTPPPPVVLTGRFIGVAALVGIINVGMWTFSLMSYKGGASIALKKLVMNGAYLSSAMTGGVIAFGEPLTAAKVVGVFLYCIAFAVWDTGTFLYIKMWLTGRIPVKNIAQL